MTRLSNLVRTGTAVLDKRFEAIIGSSFTIYIVCIFRSDKVYLTFSMELTNIEASYNWEREKLR
jgi:hypothetical protein